MQRELHLTPAQRHQVEDILQDTRFKVQTAHRDFEHQRQQLFWQAFDQIRSILTPEQQQKFDADFAPPAAKHRREHQFTP